MGPNFVIAAGIVVLGALFAAACLVEWLLGISERRKK